MSGIMNMLLGARTAIAAAVDEFFNRVTLLLPGDGTNGAQNNTFLDSSTNNFTITRNGNTTQGTFSPFSQTGWSNYFAATSDYLTPAIGSGQAFGTGDFTVECWLYTGVSACNIMQPSSGTNTWGFLTFSNQFYWQFNGGNVFGAGTVPSNTWTHLAVSRVSGTLSGYVNGTRVYNAADSNNYSGTPTRYIGPSGGGSAPFFVSNARVVKGTGLYSGATITVPTSPLTSVTNTELLTCNSNRFVDTNTQVAAKTITVNGSPSVQPFSPFAPTIPYSAGTNGGSGYFDGTGDYLTAASNAAFGFGTGDATIEAWIYPTTVSGTQVFIDTRVGGAAGIGFYLSGSTLSVARDAVTVMMQGGTVIANAWNHVVWSRIGSTNRLFLNGTETTSATNSTSYPTAKCEVGAGDGGSQPLTGYMSNVRIVKGSGVSSVTVPTAPLTNIANTSLLLNFTNAGITDATAKNDLETVGNAQISTTQSKFGGSSMYFDGTGDYLTAPWNPMINVGSSTTWTIEFWGYVGASFGTYCPVSMNQNGTIRWGLEVGASATNVVFSNAAAVSFTHPSTLSINTWFHCALVRDGTTVRLYINGVASSTTSTNNLSSVASGTQLFVGRNNVAGFTFDWNGYIDDFRITTGLARYTANFTAPTAAFPTQ